MGKLYNLWAMKKGRGVGGGKLDIKSGTKARSKSKADYESKSRRILQDSPQAPACDKGGNARVEHSCLPGAIAFSCMVICNGYTRTKPLERASIFPPSRKG